MASNAERDVAIKLKRGNYVKWRIHMMRLFRNRDLLDYIQGTIIPKPLPDCEDLYISDSVLRNWIIGTISDPEVIEIVEGIETTSEVWKALENYFAQENMIWRLVMRVSLMFRIKQYEMSVSEYVKEHKEVCDNLSYLAMPVDNETKVLTLLNGLRPEFAKYFIKYMIPPVLPYFRIVMFLLSHAHYMEAAVGHHDHHQDTDDISAQQISRYLCNVIFKME